MICARIAPGAMICARIARREPGGPGEQQQRQT
jgi:hypothetical protein